MRRRIAEGINPILRVGAGLMLGLIISPVVRSQGELRAYRQIAFESGHGTLTMKKGAGDKYFALNRPDRCIWIFASSGSTTGRISSVGIAPSDLLAPRDLTVDREGNAIVADGSEAIKIFSPNGQLVTSFPFKRPEHVGALGDGRVLVSGFPKDYLMSVLDRHGQLLGGIGTPVKADDDPFLSAVLNMGAIVVDGKDNIYYVFRFMLTPTVRKYTSSGTLVGEWHLDGGDVLAANVLRAKEQYQENKKSGNYGGVPILTAAAFDDYSKTLWVASGSQLIQLDASSGKVIRTSKLILPDGKPLQADGIILDRDVLRASSFLSGIYEYQKPQ